MSEKTMLGSILAEAMGRPEKTENTDTRGIPAKRKQRYLIALPALYAAFALVVAAYWAFARPAPFLAQENRMRAEWPSFSSDEVLDGAWGAKAEEYLADHVPWREGFVGLYSYWRLLTGQQSAESVYFDRNGALLEEPAAMDPDELAKRLERIAGFARASGITATLVIAPSAGSLSKGSLPGRLFDGYRDDEAQRIAAGFAAESHGALAAIDARDALEEIAASGEKAFYRTDHHWTMSGAYAVYAELSGTLGFEPLSRGLFEVTPVHGFTGSTYSRSGLWLTPADDIETWRLPGDSWRVQLSEEPGAVRSDVHFAEKLEQKDKYAVYLGGDHPVVTIENLAYDAERAASCGETLIIVKDSYGNCLAPLLARHFAKTVLVDPRHYRFAASELAVEHGADAAVAVFSTEHIANDRDLLLLR